MGFSSRNQLEIYFGKETGARDIFTQLAVMECCFATVPDSARYSSLYVHANGIEEIGKSITSSSFGI